MIAQTFHLDPAEVLRGDRTARLVQLAAVEVIAEAHRKAEARAKAAAGKRKG